MSLVDKIKWWLFTSKVKIGVAANFPHFDLQGTHVFGAVCD